MANNLTDKLDSGQVIKSVHDNDLNALRVSVVSGQGGGGGDITVAIDASEDSIAIGDGVKLTTITTVAGKNGLDVNVITPDLDIRDLQFATDKVDVSGSSILVTDAENVTNVYNEILSVASGVLSNITSFTATQNSKLKQIDVSGENIATYEVLVNGNIVSKKRTYFGGPLDTSFFFDKGINFLAGQQVLVRVIHNRPSTANFNANIILIEG